MAQRRPSVFDLTDNHLTPLEAAIGEEIEDWDARDFCPACLMPFDSMGTQTFTCSCGARLVLLGGDWVEA